MPCAGSVVSWQMPRHGSTGLGRRPFSANAAPYWQHHFAAPFPGGGSASAPLQLRLRIPQAEGPGFSSVDEQAMEGGSENGTVIKHPAAPEGATFYNDPWAPPPANIAALEECPGFSRWGQEDDDADRKCIRGLDRMCVQLLDGQGEPLRVNDQSFWEIMDDKRVHQWQDKMRGANGDSWCISNWATVKLIDTLGCENVNIRCSATDLRYVTADRKSVLPGFAAECINKKCGPIRFVASEGSSALSNAGLAICYAIAGAVASVAAVIARNTRMVTARPLLG
eukprot:gnl/TRDRNA2_/TRDRNA2_189079_c0_seq1.p1 gnl/TRDRNA2_/TRDRNA2_189079_c0~~gnl/TRDRNA2_/TRDRNA2_189079_c0_seq1.p1  ORF type:complete len:306 (+),score=45.45 gnl/TRDRNA2_/TRDRNA2_189079_c0_seq1:77-919(+)